MLHGSFFLIIVDSKVNLHCQSNNNNNNNNTASPSPLHYGTTRCLPWASPPEVSTAMERPMPILVGSMLLDCEVLDMSPEEPNRELGCLVERKGAEIKHYCFLFPLSLLLRGGRGEATGFISLPKA